MDPTLDFAILLARETGALLRGYFDPTGTHANVKPDTSVVTEADLAADHWVAGRLREEFPADAILSEELHASLEEPARSIWIVDPLDGTTNFSLGLPFWGLSIARVVEGRPQLAVVFFPLLDELYHARLGGGAFLNGQAIHPRPFQADQPAAFFSCCSRTHRRYHVQVPYKTRILGSAAYSFCSVARGSALLAFEATPRVWDLAGGWLLVEEAGGVIETYNGEDLFPLNPDLDFASRSFPTLAAATPEELSKGRKRILPRDEAGATAHPAPGPSGEFGGVA
jgi:myo-inositol-1(or 4)-monophosphatase